MKSGIIVLGTLFVLSLCCHWLHAEELYLSLCDEPSQWWLQLGGEYPGAVGRLSTAQDEVRGGTYPGCITVGSWCCTINVATCIPDPDDCNPADTFQGPRTICP